VKRTRTAQTFRRSPAALCAALGSIVASSLVATASGAEAVAFAAAAKAGQWDAVAQLIREGGGGGGSVDVPGPDGTAAIHWAVHAGNRKAVEALVDAGANANAANRYGVTPLSIAASDGNAELLEILLRAGADPNAAEAALPEGQTLAMLAARTGRTAALDVLSSHAAVDVNATERRGGTTALMWAALDDRADAIRQLVKLGADPNLRSRLTDYPHLKNGVGLLGIEKGITYVGQTPLQAGGWTALMYAARGGAVAAVEALAASGADVNALDPVGESALTLAIINGHWDVLDALLNAGANPNVVAAAEKVDVYVAPTALYAAVDFHTLPATYGRPAPKPRVVQGSVDAAKRLLAAGANVDGALVGSPLKRQYTGGPGKLKAGATPLMRAAAVADLTMMRLLLEAGADAKAAIAANGSSPLLLAAASASGEAGSADHVPVDRSIEAVRLLLEHGADIRGVDSQGKTAVHLVAANVGAPQMIPFLVDNGAPADAKDKKGETALDLALAKVDDARDIPANQRETIEILRKLSGAK
jgi:ankyrin repeat protein